MSSLLIALALFQANAWFSSDTLYAKLKHRIDAATSSIDICFTTTWTRPTSIRR